MSLDLMEENLFKVTLDGQFCFKGTDIECNKWLLQHQPASIYHALKYEGYAIVPFQKIFGWYHYHQLAEQIAEYTHGILRDNATDLMDEDDVEYFVTTFKEELNVLNGNTPDKSKPKD